MKNLLGGNFRVPSLLTALLFALPLQARPQSGFYTNPEVEELRIELDDLKHALKTTQVELSLIEERSQKQDKALVTIKGDSKEKNGTSLSLLTAQISSLEKKVTNLEKTLEKAANDLRTLSTSVNQSLSKIQNIENEVSSHDKRLGEISQLKGTLTSISKAIGVKSTSETQATPSKTYRVKAGDTLEKIARLNNISSVSELRKINNLQNDKIVVGQELRLSP